jgi:Acetyl-CoA carboxylase, central region
VFTFNIASSVATMLKFHCRLTSSSERIPIRVYISNESGYCLDISMYKEVMDERVGQVKDSDDYRKLTPVYTML